MEVVKVGGSLMAEAGMVMKVLKDYDVLVVPGGGVFADAVREVHRAHGLSERTAHMMALLATDQYGLLLSDLSGIPAITSLKDFSRQAVILPSAMAAASGLEATWDVASDTIACYIAREAGARGFIKLTAVDGIALGGSLLKTVEAGKLLNTTTCLDKSLPAYLQKWKMSCRVVNGKREENIRRALEGEAVGTIILGG